MDFENWLNSIRNGLYFEIAMFFFEVMAIIAGILFAKKSLLGRVFIFYLMFDFVILLCDWYFILYPNTISKRNRIYFLNTTNTLIALVELSTYSFYFYKLFNSRKVYQYLFLSFWLYFFVVFIYTLNKFDFLRLNYIYIANLIGAFEFMLLVPLCFIFYRKIFTEPSKYDLTNRPSFWIVTGIFLYSVISIPIYLISYRILKYHHEYLKFTNAFLYVLPFTINFIFLTKALLCKKPLTT